MKRTKIAAMAAKAAGRLSPRRPETFRDAAVDAESLSWCVGATVIRVSDCSDHCVSDWLC
ncbi:hypothetical protein SCOCK_400064 [Actinacidiphila cocklensis]|uniref:Uncharacterized protein n=1 Tax=Actinacidiphila cocklensis TaxID=887465 RepID=A0A9W4DZM3_9ACTN|nr:hypothetical protein SCOCK_400064 [Actinacidiphila cocklensis]